MQSCTKKERQPDGAGLRNCCERACRRALSRADLRTSKKVKGSLAMQSCITRRRATLGLIL